MKHERQHNRTRGIGILAAALAAAALAPAAPTWAQARPGFESGRDAPLPGYNEVRQLQTSLYTDRTSYDSSRGVNITMTMTNNGRNAIDVNLQNVYEYDIVIRNSRSGETVWQWSRTSDARRENRRVRLNSGETRTYRELWDQRGNDGRRVPEGTYTIEGRVYPQAPMTTQVYIGSRNDDDRPGGGWGGPSRPGGGWNRPGGPGGWDRPGRPGWENDNYNLSGDLNVNDSRVRPGDRVRIDYVVTNRSDRTQTLRFNYGRQYEIEVRSRDNGRVVWRYSNDRFFTQSLTQLTLDRGERRTFSADWRPDRDLGRGTYEIVAYLTPENDRGTVARAQTTVYLEGNDWRDDYGRGRDNDGGIFRRRSDGYNDDWGGNNREAKSVNLRDLALRGSDYLGQYVSISGVFRGERNNGGGFLRQYYILESGGQNLFVVGRAPDIREGMSYRVSGTVRRAQDGRIYLQTY